MDLNVFQKIANAKADKDAKAAIDEMIAEMLYLAADIMNPNGPIADPADVARALRFGADLMTIYSEGFYGRPAKKPD